MDHKVKVLITEEEIDKRICEIAEQINKDYEGKKVHLICVLKGGALFMCELSKRLKMQVSFDFMSVSSYGNEFQSSGEVKIVKDLDDSIEGKNVLIVEDIIDSGRTLKYLKKLLYDRKAKDIKICTLLDKPSRRVEKDIEVDYTCFEIPDEFVIGYGLDFEQEYRNLPYVGVIEFE